MTDFTGYSANEAGNDASKGSPGATKQHLAASRGEQMLRVLRLEKKAGALLLVRRTAERSTGRNPGATVGLGSR